MILLMAVTIRATWTMLSASSDPQTHAVLSSTKLRTLFSGSILRMVCVTAGSIHIFSCVDQNIQTSCGAVWVPWSFLAGKVAEVWS